MTIKRASYSMVASVLAAVLVLAGCGGGKGKQTTSPDKVTAGGSGGEAGGGQGGEAGGEGAGGGGEVEAVIEPPIPTEGDPADHFLGHGDLFASTQAYTHGSGYAEPVLEIAPLDGDGMATFRLVRTGKVLETAHFWKTHKAAADEIKVGVIALMADRKDAQGIYAPPNTVDEAYSHRWWMARIASVKPLASKGFVWVAGGYKVSPDAIRILEGDDSPALVLEGKEDAHFIQADHWVAGTGPLPQGGTMNVNLAAPAGPFEGGEGRFVNITNGQIWDTSHAWQTKIAAKKDLKEGVHVLVPNVKDGSVYRAPQTRKEALFGGWWFAKVEKVQKTTVMVSGGYEVAMDALRVVK